MCPFDWSRYADRHPDAAKSSFLANGCLANARGMNRDGSDAARHILDAEGPSVAASKIPIDDASKIPMNVRARASATAQRVVVEVTTRLLGAPPEPNAPLLDAGLDSLSSAELADALETAVRVERAAANPACAPLAPFSATLAFDHPTPNALVAFLAPALEEAYARDFDVVHDEETIAATSIGSAPCLPSPDRSASIPTTLVTSLGGETASNASMSLESRAHRSTDGASRTPWVRWDADAVVADAKGFVLAPRHGGYLRDVAAFDGEAFGVAPAEASAMDPQQRMTLAWFSAVAGSIPTRDDVDVVVGVYVGAATSDYGRLIADRAGRAPAASAATGSAFLSVVAGRVAFALDARGVAIAVDTACSSGLVAAHLARKETGSRAIGNGTSTASTTGNGTSTASTTGNGTSTVSPRIRQLVGAVNLLLHPGTTAMFAAAGMLARDGRCKALDAAADGYARGEACVALAVEPSYGGRNVRVADGHARVHDDASNGGVVAVAGSAVNQDGRSASLTAPNGPSQQAALLAARRDATIRGAFDANARVVSSQTHGTGTALGDPIEIGAIRAVVDADQSPDRFSAAPFLVGATKASATHTESPAGLVALVAALVDDARDAFVAGVTHFRALNPHLANPVLGSRPIAFEKSKSGDSNTRPRHRRIVAARQTAAAPTSADANALVGASAFAFQGTNAHALVVFDAGMWCDVGRASSRRLADESRRWLATANRRLLTRASANTLGALPGRSHAVATFFAPAGDTPASAFLRHHRVAGRALFPGAAFLELAHATIASTSTRECSSSLDAIREVALLAPLVLAEEGANADAGECVQVRVHAMDGTIHIVDGATGRTHVRARGTKLRAKLFARGVKLLARGMDDARSAPIRAHSRTVRSCSPDRFVAVIAPSSDDAPDDGWRVHPAVLDAAFQSVSAAWRRGDSPRGESLRVPAVVRRVDERGVRGRSAYVRDGRRKRKRKRNLAKRSGRAERTSPRKPRLRRGHALPIDRDETSESRRRRARGDVLARDVREGAPDGRGDDVSVDGNERAEHGAPSLTLERDTRAVVRSLVVERLVAERFVRRRGRARARRLA